MANASKLDLLFTKYLYPRECSSKVPLGSGIFALVLNSPLKAPFLIAADLSGKPIEFIEKTLGVASTLSTVGLAAFFFDGNIMKAYRRKFASEGWDEIPEIEYFVSQRTAVRKSPLALLPLSKELEGLFFDIHSIMRDVDGLHADEALEELCKLIYTRSYEEEVAKGRHSFPLRSELFGAPEEHAASIRAFYKEAVDYDLRVFRLKIPQYERSRGVFNKPIILSSVALVRCYQTLQEFDLSSSQTDVKGRAFQKVLGKTTRSGMGQYFTPNPICELMAEIVSPKVSELILDPFCGSGHFLTECLKRVSEEEGKNSKAFHEFAFGKLHGIEKSERMVRVAMTDMRLSGDGHSNIRCTDALLDFANYPDISPDSFDVVITNPPFGSILSSDALANLGRFELAQGRKNSPLEILGLERSVQFLRPGGRLAILLPDNVFSSDSTQSVRSWLLNHLVPRIIVSLPLETFSPYGANVKTAILFARKMQPGEKRDDRNSVHMVQVSNVGYDAAGRELTGSDLKLAINAAKQFLAKEGW